MNTPDEQAFIDEMEAVLTERLAVLIKASGAVGLTLTQARDLASFMVAEAERLLWVIEIRDRDDPQ